MSIRAATVTSAAASTPPGPTPPPQRVPLVLASASESFVLGVDTCGFTSESTLTCSAGYCTNIGDHRGCCTGSPADCSASIWTTCRGYTDGGAGGYCGAHTLCCAAALPACMTYYFTTDREPGVTFTNVGCGTSAMYGQMYPFPPELIPTTSDEEYHSATDLTINPIDTAGSDANNKMQSTSPTGAIVGAIVGGVLLIALAILAFVLLARRRRRQQITKELISAPTVYSPVAPPPEKSGGGGGGRSSLRTRLRLSTIPEQNSPLPTSPMLSRYKSARRSYGPDWPLGSADPLESHPVRIPTAPASASAAVSSASVDLEKRLSDPRRGSAPQLQIPAFPATRLSPAPPPKSPIGGGASSSQQKQQQYIPAAPAPSSPGGMLQSPRLSFAPPASPIDAAFNIEVAKRVSIIDGAAASAVAVGPANSSSSSSSSANNNRNSHIPPRPSNTIRTSAKPALRNSVYQQQQQQQPDDGSVSPIEQSPVEGGSDGGGSIIGNPKRLSLVSAPSVRDSRFVVGAAGGRAGESRLARRRGGPGWRRAGGGGMDSGRVSPVTVSPMESRRSSLDHQ
ncbi:uncharacterized protein PG986_006966 [Apiospora aurea]|uniref:Uncharacterized protein n=1 Tax=Apiospora aurea TaxID=335848 RepID=A0ABR1QBA7_9PEZI